MTENASESTSDDDLGRRKASLQQRGATQPSQLGDKKKPTPPRSPSTRAYSPSSTKSTPNKQGLLSDSRAATTTPSPPQTPSHRSGQLDNREQQQPVQTFQPQSQSQTQTTPSRRLGRLGLRRTDTTQTQATGPHSGSGSGSGSNPSTPSRRLGRIGSRQTQSQSQPAFATPVTSRLRNIAEDEDESTASEVSRSPSPTPAKLRTSKETMEQEEGRAHVPEPQAQREETIEEKANRRREELKRSLEAATGAKKKRKF